MFKRFNFGQLAQIKNNKGETTMMTSKTKIWLGLAALAVIASVQPAKAVTSQTLDIKVSISATKSLAVGATFYNYGPLAVAVSSVSSAIAVENDSGALVETYTIQGANALSTGGGTTWTLAGSPGSDIYTLDAQFVSAQPNAADGSWTTDALTTSVIECTTTTLGGGNDSEDGAGVAPGSFRNLYFRLKTPTSVSDTTQRNTVVTLAVK